MVACAAWNVTNYRSRQRCSAVSELHRPIAPERFDLAPDEPRVEVSGSNPFFPSYPSHHRPLSLYLRSTCALPALYLLNTEQCIEPIKKARQVGLQLPLGRCCTGQQSLHVGFHVQG